MPQDFAEFGFFSPQGDGADVAKHTVQNVVEMNFETCGYEIGVDLIYPPTPILYPQVSKCISINSWTV